MNDTHERSPGPAVTTEARLTDVVHRTVGGYQHAAGTCRTGPPEDPRSVVSTVGAVHGMAGLYVVDASVMPDLPAANTNLTTMAIAEHRARTRWATPSAP